MPSALRSPRPTCGAPEQERRRPGEAFREYRAALWANTAWSWRRGGRDAGGYGARMSAGPRLRPAHM